MSEAREPVAVSARCAVDVMAGVVPGKAEDEFTRRWFITSDEWYAAEGPEQNHLLTDIAGKASGYATFLMVQPDRFNWVKSEWVWF